VNQSSVHENQKLTERLKRGELPIKFRKKRPANFLCPFLQPSRFFWADPSCTYHSSGVAAMFEKSRDTCNAKAETIVNHSKWSLYLAADSLSGPAANVADYTDCFGGRKLISWILGKFFSGTFFGAKGY
jgi:hypothetical protein